MDSAARPQSIVGSACQALISTVHQVSADVTNFVRRCRSARTDLAPVTRELSELQMVLQLVNDFEAAQRDTVPEELQMHLRPIITNCIGVVTKVHEVLQRQEAAGWTVEARDEVGELAKSLGVHRAVMGVVADLIFILLSRGAGDGAGAEAGDGHGAGDEHHQIMVLLEELQTLGSSLVISYSNATLAREHFALQVHLGQIVTYTQTLAHTDLWQDAVRTLDEAQQMAVEDLDHHQQQHPGVQRASILLPAPLGRGHSTNIRDVAAAGVRNSGLENLLPLGPLPLPLPPSMYSVSNQRQESKSLATIERAGPSGTGFIVMDGFNNSAQAATAMGSMGAHHEKLEQRSSQYPAVPRRSPTPSRRSYEEQSSAELAVTRPIAQHLAQATPEATRVLANDSGLQVQIPTEKELAEEEEVSAEALAFAQVPIHVLDRLSLNLVEHVYGGSPSSAGDRSSGNNVSQSMTRHSQDGNDFDRNNGVASTDTSDTGGHRAGHLQCSSPIETSKAPSPSPSPLPAAIASPTLHRSPNFSLYPSPSSRSHTSRGRSQRQRLPSASHPLSSIPSASASQVVSKATDEGTEIPSSRPSIGSSRTAPNRAPASNSGSSPTTGHNDLRLIKSSSTIKTSTSRSYMSQKPLPRVPLVYVPGYPGPFIKKKVVVVGNFSCGKTCLITRMARGQYPRSKDDELRITETVKLSVDETPIELCFWDIRGIDYDPSWLNDAHVALVCFSVNIGSTDSKGKHLGRWVAEVNRNCAGAAVLLVGLKSDIRFHAKSVEKLARTGKALVTPEQGEQFRHNIGATRYVECSARTGEGVLDVLAETARVAMQVGVGASGHARRATARAATAAAASAPPPARQKSSAGGGVRQRQRPLSRIGKFFGFGQSEG